MKVVEIFDSIDGEGIRTGKPCSFIRLAGCNLRCSYCDTLYSLFGEAEPCKYTEMSIDEILGKINHLYRRITLTGGEPLLHEDSAALVSQLINNGYEVNIETNGAVDIVEFLNHIPKSDNMFFTIDYKLPSSGMSEKMLWNNFVNLRASDVIKYVVGSDEDVNVMKAVTKNLLSHYSIMPHIYVGVVFGMYSAEKLVDIILHESVLKDAVFQIQLHKVIWAPDKRGV